MGGVLTADLNEVEVFSVESEWQSTSVPRKHSKQWTSVIRKMGNVFAADLNEVKGVFRLVDLCYLCNCVCHCILRLSNIYPLDGRRSIQWVPSRVDKR